MTTELAQLIGRLLTLPPGSEEAERQQHRIEHVLMAALRAGGRADGDALVHSLADQGYKLKRLDALPCMWRVVLPRPRVLELWFTGGENPAVAALSYRVGRPWGNKREKRATQLQAAFYARHEALGAVDDIAGLAPDDRLILLVGEFEADVNNGGFGQYIGNKGVEQAQAALACLTAVGAKRSARWLSSALQGGTDPAALHRLDEQFFERPEDLPSLVMDHLARQKRQGLVVLPNARPAPHPGSGAQAARRERRA